MVCREDRKQVVQMSTLTASCLVNGELRLRTVSVSQEGGLFG